MSDCGELMKCSVANKWHDGNVLGNSSQYLPVPASTATILESADLVV